MTANPFTRLQNQADKVNLIGREAIVEQIAQKTTSTLQANSVLLYGLTGIGKSTLIRAITQNPSAIFAPACQPVLGIPFADSPENLRFLSIGFRHYNPHHTTPEMIFAALAHGIEELERHQYQALKLEKLNHLDPIDFQSLYKKAAQARADYRFVIGMDDFDRVLIENSDIDALNSLRALSPLVAFIITSTHSPREWQERSAALTGSPWFNISVPTEVSLFAPDEAAAFVRAALGTGETVSMQDADVDWLLNFAGPHPHFILLVGEQVHRYIKQTGRVLSASNEVELIADRCLEVAWSALVDFWHQFSDDQMNVMRQVADTGSTIRDAAFVSLWRKGILQAQGEGWRLFSNLFAEFVRQFGRDQTPRELTGLTPLEQSFYRYLSSSAGKICTYDELINSIWQRDKPQNPNEALNSLASRLRRKIDDAAIGELQTFRGQGYRFVPK
ncbi:MAG: AAA family ATPase [Chloroflexi bacterium]|nr:AAA family ATPase [Chloroflexota bacterium]